MLSNRSLLATLALLALAATSVACSQGSSSPVSVGHPGESASGGDNAGSSGGGEGTSSGTSSGTTSGGGGSGGASSGSTGASSGSSSGSSPSGPPPSQPASPNGFQLTIAPLLDAQGCTECHHHGRPIDLTTYPFMSGTAEATTQALVAAFTTNMPPAPRTAVPQTVIDQVNAWAAAGMKP